jgi:hypothetical protein
MKGAARLRLPKALLSTEAPCAGLWSSEHVAAVDVGEACERLAKEERKEKPEKVENGCVCPPRWTYLNSTIEVGSCRLKFVHDCCGEKRDDWGIAKDLYRVLDGARCSIVLVAPYFLPAGELGEIFEAALDRGVRVVVLTNSLATTDSALAYAGYSNAIARYHRKGMEVWEYTGPRILHTKMFVIDGKTACLTTFNFNPRSENLNTETGLIMADPQAALKMEQIMDYHFASATRIDAKSAPWTARRYTREAVSQVREYGGEGRDKASVLRLQILRPAARLIRGQL